MHKPSVPSREALATPDPTDTISDTTIELHIPTLAGLVPELLFQTLRLDSLPLRKYGQRQGQRKHRRRENETQVHGQHGPWSLLHPLRALQPDQDQWRQDHDRRRVEDARECRLAYSKGGCFFRFTQGLQFRAAGLAFLARGLAIRGEDVDASSDLLATHEEDVESACAGDSGEGDEAAEGGARCWAEAFEAWD